MSNHPDIINISSDSSSSESEESGWTNYLPPCVSSSSSKKPKRKIETAESSDDLPTPPSYVFYSSSSYDDETYTLSKELPKALTQALESALSNMKKIPVPEKPARLSKPPKQVLGLDSPRMWSTFDNQRKSAQKAKHNYKGKGKKPME